MIMIASQDSRGILLYIIFVKVIYIIAGIAHIVVPNVRTEITFFYQTKTFE